ncbi:hypothetical protein [Victivallis vadensis]|uniref:hypothetical protein n=1 Tax=Victivallis vadensis TaxID=172901 RepID=UPI002672465E|nr:hypothetical protein [Victivallis vadensis]
MRHSRRKEPKGPRSGFPICPEFAGWQSVWPAWPSQEDYRRIRNACNFCLPAFERERHLKEIRNCVILQKQIFDNIMTPVVLFDLSHTIIAAIPARVRSIPTAMSVW